MSQGQILPGSAFGDLLTKYARDADTIVELGTFGGEGSTLCLHLGLRKSATLYSVEIDPKAWYRGKFRWHDEPNMVFLLGRVGNTFDDYAHPGGEEMRKTIGYDFCRDQFLKAPNVIDKLPKKISLLLIDAGEWSASGELAALIDRTEIVALDDTSVLKAHKNVENRLRLIRRGWTVLADDQEDRNGYSIFRRHILPNEDSIN